MKTQKGFTLIEIIIVLALMAAAIGMYFGYQKFAIASQERNATTTSLVAMASKIRDLQRYAGGGYTGFTSGVVNSAGLVDQPVKWDGTVLREPRGGWVDVRGATGSFSIRMNFDKYPSSEAREACVSTAQAFAASADIVVVGGTWLINGTGGVATGGTTYKAADGTRASMDALIAGCTATTVGVVAQFH